MIMASVWFCSSAPIPVPVQDTQGVDRCRRQATAAFPALAAAVPDIWPWRAAQRSNRRQRAKRSLQGQYGLGNWLDQARWRAAYWQPGHATREPADHCAGRDRPTTRVARRTPTVGELGINDLQLKVLYVVWVPKGTPRPVVQYLQKAVAEAPKRPQVQSQFTPRNVLQWRHGCRRSLQRQFSTLRPRDLKTGMKVDQRPHLLVLTAVSALRRRQ